MKIAIIGAGIIGRLIAWQLVHKGHNISVFDKNNISQQQSTSFTAAGMLTPYSEIESAEWEIYEMGLQGLGLWTGIVSQLNSRLSSRRSKELLEGANVEGINEEFIQFSQTGSLVVAHQQDYADLQRFTLQLQHKNVANSSAGDSVKNNSQKIQHLDQKQLAALEPELAKQFKQAIYLPQEASLSAYQTMVALAKQAIALGVNWHENCFVEKVRPHYIWVNGTKKHFDLVIDSRGLGAKQDIPQLRGVRGELLWVEAEVNINTMVRLIHPRYRLYLVPQARSQGSQDHNTASGKVRPYILGATQIESEDYSPMSVRSMLELLSALYSIHPSFAEARITEMKTHCRPALPDNLPNMSQQSGLIRINGLFRHGYLLAPVLSETITKAVDNIELAPSIKASEST